MKDPVSPEVAQQNAKIIAKQRRLERSIRMAKKTLKASEWIGYQEDIEHFKSIVRARQAVLRQFIEDNKTLLHRSYDREQVYS